VYEIIREEIIPGSLEDFRALMHEKYELQPQFKEDGIFLQGERTPPDYPENLARWEVTLGGTLQQRGFILARQLPNGTTKLQFAYNSKFQPIGLQFDIEFVKDIMRQYTTMDLNADILIITVTKVESRAVIDVFEEITGQTAKVKPIGDRVYHDLGAINGTRVFMVQSEMGSGGLGGSRQTAQKGIAALSPTMVIMAGIAFGIDADKQSIGDVLVSERLMLYDLQRVGTEQGKLKLIPRGDRPHASPRLINLFRSGHLFWDKSRAKVHFGLVLSGEKLVDNIDFRHQLHEFEPEAIGGEMEGAGLYVACQDAKVDWILVKSICDWADGNKAEHKDERQRLAAHNAAEFILRTLQRVPLREAKGTEAPSPPTQSPINILSPSRDEASIRIGDWFRLTGTFEESLPSDRLRLFKLPMSGNYWPLIDVEVDFNYGDYGEKKWRAEIPVRDGNPGDRVEYIVAILGDEGLTQWVVYTNTPDGKRYGVPALADDTTVCARITVTLV
jgi:nucleoside phosphorylase